MGTDASEPLGSDDDRADAGAVVGLDPEVGITVEKLEKIVLYLAEGIDYHTEGDTVEA